jgi:hypothetical protein
MTCVSGADTLFCGIIEEYWWHKGFTLFRRVDRRFVGVSGIALP